ncbi:MAG: hypothetical protein ACR2MB_09025 [Acidimicrobiales bacterium]
MAKLEIPDDIEGLCLARHAEVNPLRPLFTGDVITEVTVPVLGDQSMPVALVGHPCAMRKGADLAPYLHVAPVLSYQPPSATIWAKHIRVMPIGPIADFPHGAIQLDQMTLVKSSTLDLSKRVFCATRPGINLLRQRLVHCLTRVVVPTHLFDEEAAGAHEEIDLMEDWLDTATSAGLTVADATATFHQWIRERDGETSRQELLTDPQAVAGIRRAMRAEMRQRYAS